MYDLALSSVNVLSLCAGGGGLDLGIRLAVPAARTICYVEWEVYAAAVLAARMADGALDDAPIWSDLVTFDSRPWRGVVDLVIAGFPCQPWSVAGQRRGTDDERWLWPNIARIIREVGPRIVFLENVPPLVRGGLEHVLRDLAQNGFDAEWDCFSAAQVGLPHVRKRIFILAYRPSEQVGITRLARQDSSVADANGDGLARERPLKELLHSKKGQIAFGHNVDGCDGARAVVGDAHREKLQEQRRAFAVEPQYTGAGRSGDVVESGYPIFPPGPADRDAWRRILERAPHLEPTIRRVADELADRVGQRDVANRSGQLRLLGNGVVPLTAAVAFLSLWQRLGSDLSTTIA